MATRLVQIAMNAQDDSALGHFWAAALGWGMSSEGPGVTNLEPVGFAYPDPAAVCIDVLAVPESRMVWLAGGSVGRTKPGLRLVLGEAFVGERQPAQSLLGSGPSSGRHPRRRALVASGPESTS